VGTLRAEAGAGMGWGPVGIGGGGTMGSTLRAVAERSWLGCAMPWRMSMRSFRAWAWLSVSGAKGVGRRVVEGMDNVCNAGKDVVNGGGCGHGDGAG